MTYREEFRARAMDERHEEKEIVLLAARIEARILALVGAIVGGLGLFLMTAWLVAKGGPHVGAHLQLLGNFFYGYSVTWWGSLVGFGYGAVVGAASGWLVGSIYNGVVYQRRP